MVGYEWRFAELQALKDTTYLKDISFTICTVGPGPSLSDRVLITVRLRPNRRTLVLRSLFVQQCATVFKV